MLDEELEGIRRNAALVVEMMLPISGIDFGYDAESVKWLDAYINRVRVHEDPDDSRDKLIGVLGSYLSECIIRTYGGEWKRAEFGLGVFFNEDNAAYPFNKVGKQFMNGEGDSIYSFFTGIAPLFGPGSSALRGAASPIKPQPKKSWWRLW